MQHGAGILRENCQDQDNRQCPGKDALTPDRVGSRRARDALFNGIVARARCARFKSSPVVVGAGNGASKRGSPGQCELVGPLRALLLYETLGAARAVPLPLLASRNGEIQRRIPHVTIRNSEHDSQVIQVW